jgi:hypothetical protein
MAEPAEKVGGHWTSLFDLSPEAQVHWDRDVASIESFEQVSFRRVSYFELICFDVVETWDAVAWIPFFGDPKAEQPGRPEGVVASLFNDHDRRCIRHYRWGWSSADPALVRHLWSLMQHLSTWR